MKLVQTQVIGEELAMKWDDGAETFVPLSDLRRACPCAACAGETDVLGQVHRGPVLPLTARSFQLQRLVSVGGYGIQPVWGDGHSTGIYTLDSLRKWKSSAS